MTGSFNLFKEELKIIFTGKVYFLLIFALPVLLAIILGMMYNKEIIRDIPVAIFDEDNSELSRTISRYLHTANYIDISQSVNSLNQAQEALFKEEVFGIVHIPRGAEDDIKTGKTVQISVLKNTTNLVIGNVILKDVSTVIRTVSAGVVLKKLRASGLMEENALNLANPIRIETKSLFNPNYSYLYFLVPGLIMVTFQMSAMIIGVMIISSEFKKKTISQFLSEKSVSILQFLGAKLSAHLIAHTALFLFAYFVLFFIFNINLKGNFFQQYTLFLFFILSALSLGILISTLINNQVLSTEIAMILNAPAFLFSGLTFPLWGMPALHQIFAQSIPFTHYLEGFLGLNYIGLNLTDLGSVLAKLSLFIFIPLIVSYFVLFTRRKRTI